MSLVHALKYNGKWRLRLTIGLILIGPLYVAPSILRSIPVGWAGYACGVVLAGILGSLLVGFLTNSYRFGVLLCLGATAFEFLLLYAGYQPHVASWIGDLIPALVAIYFAQQLYINVGD